jgi:FecR protein
MKKGIQLILLILAILAVPLSADERERHQSFISYDDGGTIVRTGDDNREIEAHRNLPVYPGDEVVTGRRGRAEIHLSDGNIIALDRETVLRLRSILDSYEGDDDETVVELRAGKIAVHRTDIGRDVVRLDTNNASYVANHEAVYSVESDARGRDRIVVFTGNVEVRTPQRATRLRAGESASVDERGPYDLVGDQRYSADDFERWFLKRAERFGTYTSKYMDRRLSYWNSDLDDHGRWVFITGIGWTWRPYVATGWRPYHNGYWANRFGSLTWVSYDPWGWGTYHYGRWAYDPFHGWIWVPGYGYSPAWVYWWYGPNYVGWAPRGYWDCHRGYYDWAYRPYRRSSIGFGFHGRVRVSDMDMRPWVFVDSNTLITHRVDRAALTTDAIKNRLGRNRDGFATVSGTPARFTREELRDPAASIRRRSIGGDQGIEAGTPNDLTPYFRRDPNISTGVRDRIVRSRGGSPAPGTSTPTQTGSVAPIGRGNVAPIGGGSVAPIGGGSVAPVGGGSGSTDSRRGGTVDSGGRISRGGGNNGNDSGSASGGSSTSGGSWRDRGRGGDSSGGSVDRRESNPPASSPDSGSTSRGSGDTWRRRVRSDDPAPSQQPSGGSATEDRGGSDGSDVPRRVIDRIGGARIVPRDDSGSAEANRDAGGSSGSNDRSSGGSSWRRGSGDSDSSSSSGSGSRDRSVRSGDDSSRSSGGSRDRSVDRGGSSSDRGSSSRGSGSSAGSDRGSSSRGSSGGGSSTRSNDSGSRSSGAGNSSSGGNRESGGRIKRD